ncbi:MAG: bifunctional alpha,alpha-trehalose-phosphate synthase (UDP-forming)/trehalose-phosphatase [Phycisphaerae bacterium]|jgi:trehalose 6-phosphate synthase/phosphatase
MPRLIVVSNRLPVSISKSGNELNVSPSPGGLATGLSVLPDDYEHIWIGWPGGSEENYSPKDCDIIEKKLNDINCSPVFLSSAQVQNYYEGFSNSTLWPLFHYFPTYTIYEERFWQFYATVNELFCENVAKIARPDDFIWVHDYHLMLLPQMLRTRLPKASIGYFLHIPFPSFELFRLLPWRKDLLEGLLGADLIGFHTHDYVRHFLSSVSRIMGYEHHLGTLTVKNRIVKVDTFPMGIDYRKYADAHKSPDVKKEIENIRRTVGEHKVIVSIDRLDYTKGIIQRLEAFDWFLTQNPEYVGKVTMILVAVPSRSNVTDYQRLRNNLEKLISRINGEKSQMGYIPVHYLYRSLSFENITSLYDIADVALVTPLRDGMNLIAKEYVAAKENRPGVLILSEMAGAASELGEALIVNANNKQEIVDAIKIALDMPDSEKTARLEPMQKRLQTYDIKRWAYDFINTLSELNQKQKIMAMRKLTDELANQLCEKFKLGSNRLLMLDYDGTLVRFHNNPEQAGPDEQVLDLLERLSQEPSVNVVVISGRTKSTLEKWLGSLNVTLIAEHGAWFKWTNGRWHQTVASTSDDWKEQIRPILQIYVDRTPGSLIEEKDFCLVWHFRKSDPSLAEVRYHELLDTLVNLTANMRVGVFEGNKLLEVKQQNINKGVATESIIKKFKPDFVLAAGDDYTDEDMFAVLPREAWSVKVGSGASKAMFYVESVDEIRNLLLALAGDCNAQTR